jgi:hypothetical protein
VLARLIAMLAGAALFLPGTALGAATTIGFDDQAAGTEVTSASGVTFRTLPGIGQRGFYPLVIASPGEAQSPPNVASIANCPGCETYTPEVSGTFDTTRNFVSARVGFPAGVTSDPAVLTLTAYDSSGNAIGTSSPVTVSQGNGVHSLISVATASATIAGFDLRARDPEDSNKSLAIDDLTFSNDGPPPPPDFSLAPADGNLVMRQGATITDKINIGRFNGSSGNVTLALSGPLPAGVHASFQPNPAGGTSSDLVLTADADAATTGFNPVTLTITGSPASAAVGPIGHTVQLNLQVRSAFDVSVASPTVDIAPCEVSVPVTLVRDFALTDPVALSVTGLANGLQASFSPASATFPGGAAGQTVSLIVDGPPTGFPVPATTLTIHAVAPNLPERTATVTVSGTCPATYDPRVTSMQITQGTQSTYLPEVDPSRHPPNAINYADIPSSAKLRAGGPTIVRVYANLAIGPAGGAPNVPMVLYGSTYDRFGQAKALPGSPISPTYVPAKLAVGPATADPADVFKAAAAYVFTLPPEWTKSEMAVGTGFLPTTGTTQKLKPCETTECTANDNFQIVHIPMFAAPPVTIKPAQLTVDGAVALPDPASVFSRLRVVDPFDTILQPYAGTIDITDISNTFKSCNAGATTKDASDACSDDANEDTVDRFEDWVCDNGAPTDPGWDMGVNTGVARGIKSPNVCISTFEYFDDAVVEVNRPLTSVSHEFFHLLGRPHASDCNGGGSDGQVAESWPPDEKGLLQGVGLDTTLGSATPGAYALMGTPPTGWFDLMSYCATNPGAGAWISVHNWNAALDEHRYHRSVRRRLRATGPKIDSLHVSAFAGADGTVRIALVAPVSAQTQPASESGYHLVGRDAAGNVVADLQMLSSPTHSDGRPPALALDGVIPAAGVASVTIVRDGAAVASRAASAHAPAVSVRGVPSFRRGRATIRWRASDADHDTLQARVEYSSDGGATYRQIASGPNHGRVQLPARLLSRSKRARVRVRVNDGFRETAATSRAFRSPGGAPVVQILSPRRGARQPNDAPLVLRGQAFDDVNGSLTGKRLRWYVGRKLVGTGTQTAPVGLRAGRHRVQLLARDRFGRVGRAAITVHLTAARPAFLVLKAPASVSRSARSVALKVASTLRARLTVRGGRGTQRARVSRRTRTVRVVVKPGRSPLALRLTLVAGGRSTPATIAIARS